jgi:hypothetical protein
LLPPYRFFGDIYFGKIKIPGYAGEQKIKAIHFSLLGR